MVRSRHDGNCCGWWVKDINKTSSSKRGRRGMNYWEITVLAAYAWAATWITTSYKIWRKTIGACSRSWVLATGKSDEVDFDWRRIEDNLIKLRPETLKKINDLIVAVQGIIWNRKPSKRCVATRSWRRRTFTIPRNRV